MIGKQRLPKVSVIIPTTDKEKDLLDTCVKSIQKSTYKNVEIIVVNEGKERSAQRNIGIDRATGEYFLFLDSDQFISPHLITDCVKKMNGYSAVYIPEKIVTDGFFGRLRNWERQFYTATSVDVVRFVKAVGCPMFDETMSGPEDSDWDRRVKGLRCTSEWDLYHLDNIGFIKYLKKKSYYNKSMNLFKNKWPKDKVLNWKWRCFGVYFERGKWKRCIQSPFMFLCLMGLIFIRGIIYKCQTKF